MLVACSRQSGEPRPAQAELQQGLGGPQRWMKKPRPNELALMILVDEDCPGERSRYVRTVTRALYHDRVEPTPVVLEEMHLNVSIDCFQGEAPHLFTAEAEFVRVLDPYGVATSLGPGYVETGLGSYWDILESSEAVTQRALADYLTANFDL